MNDLVFASLVTLASGLTMGLGAMFVFLTKRENTRVIAFSIGLSAGAMLMIAFMGIMPSVGESFSELYGEEKRAVWQPLLMFVVGLLVMIGVDKLLPSSAHNHPNAAPDLLCREGESEQSKMLRTGIAIAVAIGVHNIPEGVATFATLLDDRSLGLMVVLAVVLHNIPIGIAIAMPIFLATGSRGRALVTALLTGLVSPVAALLAYLFMMPFLSPVVMSSLLAVVAGVMVYISIDELIPASRRIGHHHLSTYGVVAGIVLITLVFVFFGE